MKREKLSKTHIKFSDRQFDKFMHAFKHKCGVSVRLKNNQLMSGGHPVLVTHDQFMKIFFASAEGNGVLLKMTPKLMYLQAFA